LMNFVVDLLVDSHILVMGELSESQHSDDWLQ